MAETGRYCPHLERLLPATKGVDAKRFLVTDRIDHYLKDRMPEYEPGEGKSDLDEERELRAKLAKYGLPAKKIEVVIARVFYGKRYREIAIDLGYSDATGARTAYVDAAKWLKKAGYGEK